MTALCRGVRLLILLMGIAGVALSAQNPAHGQERQQDRQPIKFPDTQYEPVDWADLDGWNSDDHEAAFATYLASCRALNVKRRSDGRGNQRGRELTGIAAALRYAISANARKRQFRSTMTARKNSSKRISVRSTSTSLAIRPDF